jgi:hypothetical protein
MHRIALGITQQALGRNAGLIFNARVRHDRAACKTQGATLARQEVFYECSADADREK